MRKILFILFLIIPFSLFAGEVDNGYKINSWTYEATIHKNNVWDVKEVMNVTFLEDRHGIYRYIPRHFTIINNVNGESAEYNYESVIENVNVEGFEFNLSDNDDNQENLIIRIGSENETLTGDCTYVITYQIQVPDDRYSASDFIYTSVLGPDCNTTINNFDFTLNFDKNLPSETLDALRVFSGEWGSTDNDLELDVYVSENSIYGSAINIDPFNGITLRAEIQDGYWEDAHSETSTTMYIFFGLSVLFFLIVIYFFLKNSRKKPLTVIEYSAPDGISSAEVGVIIDNSADLSDLTSLIVWFASKGYLKIREIEGKKHLIGKNEIDIELTKLKNLPKDAPKYQKKFWNIFFEKEDTVLLSALGDRHKDIQEAQQALQNEFNGKRSLQSTNYKCLFSILGFFFCGMLFFNGASSVCTLDSDMIIYCTVFWAAPALIATILRMILSSYDMITTTFKKFLQYAAIIFCCLVNIFVLVCFYNEYDSFASLDLLMSVTIGGWIIALFGARICHDSKYRLEKMSLLLGFREFIEKSELPMLKAQVDENPSYFFDVLPYAMVFDLTDKWVKKFKEIDIQNPDWYEGSSALTSYMLADHISHAVSNQISKSINVSSHDTTPSSSSSGGGFSGGGVGGGGCGSW